MSLSDYLPSKDSDLDLFCQNFDTKITATPTAYGLVAGDATAFHTLRLAFTNALITASASSTRTKDTVAAKNLARFNMTVSIRALANRIQAYASITSTLLAGLGLTVRDHTPSPITAPSTAPIVTPLTSAGGRINFRFADTDTPASKSKPPGVTQLQLWAKVGTTPPASIADCNLVGVYTKNSEGPGSRQVSVGFTGADTGKTAYLIGRWQTRRGLVGPSSAIASMTIAA
jgi:hypothetical protein